MLGFTLKSSRHPAGALPVFEGVACDDPPSSEADTGDDSLLQHCVDRETANVQTTCDLLDAQPRRGIHGRFV